MQPGARLKALQSEGTGSSGAPARKATLKPVGLNAADIPRSQDELQIEQQAEQQLLVLVNESRQRAGAARLTLDEGLSNAARLHAQAMIAAGQMSHQFDGERSLQQRIADSTSLQFDREAENVTFASDAEHSHEHFMLSPAHRANLLNPAYNVAGLGVLRSGGQLYVVEVFGHAVAGDGPEEMKNRIAVAVNLARRDVGQLDLKRNDLPAADDAACSMAHADKLDTPEARSFSVGSTAFSYTALHPETLPRGMEHAIANHNLQRVMIGTCYGHSVTHPTGAYWVVVAMN